MLRLSSSRWSTEIPPLGFGCCPMGGHGWGYVDEMELIQAVRAALDVGVQFFDTSDIYGLGASEMLLGRALRERREKAVIATKFGVRYQNGQSFHDTSVQWINTAVDGSLRRLGVDCIDLYQMHYWDGKTPLDEIAAVLESLQVAGKIRAFGITNHDPRDQAWSTCRIKPICYSYHYSLVHREHEAAIVANQSELGLVFMSWGSLGQGVLSGKYQSLSQLDPSDRRQREEYLNFHGAKFAAIQQVLQEMKLIAAEAGITSLTQLALRWIIDHIPRALPLVGVKRPEQIIDAAAVLRFKLDPVICARLDRLTNPFIAGPSGPMSSL